MALLMSGSLLLIGASTALLVVGWLNASRATILTSMGGLAGAAILLAFAYARGRKLVDRAGGEPLPPTAELHDRPVSQAPPSPEPEPEPEPPKPEPAAPKPPARTPVSAVRSTGPAAGTAAGRSRSAAKKKSAASKQAPRVVVFPDRDKYHRPECRFAKGRGKEKVTKTTARRWGYEPCGVCNP